MRPHLVGPWDSRRSGAYTDCDAWLAALITRSDAQQALPIALRSRYLPAARMRPWGLPCSAGSNVSGSASTRHPSVAMPASSRGPPATAGAPH
jgi:hypothetical protein